MACVERRQGRPVRVVLVPFYVIVNFIDFSDSICYDKRWRKELFLLTKVFYAGYSLLFLGLFTYLALMHGTVGLGVALIGLTFYLFSRVHSEFLARHFNHVFFIFLILFFGVNVFSAFWLRHTPIYDLSGIFHGAIEWHETGDFQNHYEYFYYFPNNLGGLVVLRLVFDLFGGFDYHMAASMFNSFLCVLTVFFAVRSCVQLGSIRAGYFVLLLFLFSSPFWFMGAVYYTDSLSMLFPVLLFYLYLNIEKKGYIFLFAVFGVLGCFIKFTVCIMLIAVLISSFFNKKAFHVVTAVFLTCMLGIICHIVFDAYMYCFYLSRPIAEKMNTPFSHWIMMGLQGNGGYRPADYDFTKSFTSKAAQTEGIKNMIYARFRLLWPDGLWDLFWRKMDAVFGSGTLCQSDFLDDGPVYWTRLHDILLYQGKYYSQYQVYCQSVMFFSILCAGLHGVKSLFSKVKNDMALCLAMVGVCLFFAIWETSGRYITNFVPVIFCISSLFLSGGVVDGSDSLSGRTLLQRRGNVARNNWCFGPKAAGHV